jgi:SAM-dependent methyltransferase
LAVWLTDRGNGLYDRIGDAYGATRVADPRFATAIEGALGDARSVLNVGAGTGSYEPTRRLVAAVEPSATTIRQRPAGAAPVIQAVAEHLPVADGAVDATLAIYTIHHWEDQSRGLSELRRVARRRIVIFISDWRVERSFWFNEQYLPDLTELDRDLVPTPEGLLESLGGGELIDVPVPHDCLDGFLTAYWRRPAAFLDDRVRAGISYFSMIPTTSISGAIDRLGRDLESGRWLQRNGWLLDLDELDTGQRLVVAKL